MQLSKQQLSIMLTIILLLITTEARLTYYVAASLNETVVKVEPPLTEFGNPAGDPIAIPGTQFTIAVNIYNVTELYGFDIKFRWNTTYLEYVSHSVRVPKNTYSDGVLWNPTFSLADEVNTTAGTYWVACASMKPAPGFNGSGTFFTMTFEVKRQPYDYETGGSGVDPIDTVLGFISTDLAQKDPVGPIPHSVETASVRIWERSVTLSAPTLKVMPANIEKLSTNITFDIDIWIIGLDPSYDVAAFNITLNFNSSLIEAIGLTEGQWPKSYAENTTEILKQIDNLVGATTYALELIPPRKPTPPATGILFTVAFRVVFESLMYPPPSCELALAPTIISDRTQGPISHIAENSTYTANRPLPVAKFRWSPQGPLLKGQAITFNASESYHPLGGSIELYHWSFGDGTEEILNDTIVSHTYLTNGTMMVILNVTDYGGFWNTDSATLYILDIPRKPHLAIEPAYIEFGPLQHAVGQQFNISIYVRSLDAAWSLQSIGFSLSYNTTLIDIAANETDVNIPSLWRGPNNITILRLLNTLGKATFTLREPSVTPSGNVLVGTIKFTTKYQGVSPAVDRSPLNLSDIQLVGNYREIPLDPPNNGQIVVYGSASARLNSTITIDVLPQNVTVNSNVTIKGFIAPTQIGANITVYQRLSGGAWTTLATIKTDQTGNYTYSWKPSEIGIYEIKANWIGDEEFYGAESSAKTLTVKKPSESPSPETILFIIAAVAVAIVAVVGIYLIKIRKPKE